MSDRDTMKAEALVDDMTELKVAIKGVSYTLAHEFMPIASGVTTTLRAMIVEMNKAGDVSKIAKSMKDFVLRWLTPALHLLGKQVVMAFGMVDLAITRAIFNWKKAALAAMAAWE